MTDSPAFPASHELPVPATLTHAVRAVSEQLATAGVVGAATEARELVAAVLDRPRFWPTLHGDDVVPAELMARIAHAARRRAAGAPFQYAVGTAVFRFLTLAVDERVLIPRPETERLVDLVLTRPQAHAGGSAADIGTGSGAIALALAAEGRLGRVIGTDVSLDALGVAAGNARSAHASLRATVEWRVGSALAPVQGEQLDLLVSNPPYIAWEEVGQLPRLVRDWEPSQALACAEHGLAVTREIVMGAPGVLRPGGLLALEVDARRAGVVARMVASTGAFTEITVRPDYAGRERFVLAVRRDTQSSPSPVTAG